MSFCQEQSLPFLSILTHLNLFCVFMAPPLSVPMISKVMGWKWFAFKLMKTMYEIVNKQVKFLTAFPSSQMNSAKLALAMSWRGNV